MSHVPSTDICIVHALSQRREYCYSLRSQDVVPRTTLEQALRANNCQRITKLKDHAASSRTQLHEKNLILQPSAIVHSFSEGKTKIFFSISNRCSFLQSIYSTARFTLHVSGVLHTHIIRSTILTVSTVSGTNRSIVSATFFQRGLLLTAETTP